MPRSISGSLLLVSGIGARRGLHKIRDSIVSTNAIHVVNNILWVLAVVNGPRYAMREMRTLIQRNPYIALAMTDPAILPAYFLLNPPSALVECSK